jgi:uncharacterized membrane protein YecN with MAPEG domain
MPSRMKTALANPRWDSEVLLLTWLATCVSVLSFLFVFQRGDVLLYGDAVAHINIARRVFDSKTPGLLQLGTVWLPLPHLLMIPFLVSKDLWQRGAGGSIPSMAAYVLGVVGMFRLVRGVLSRSVEPDMTARIAAWIAVIAYAGNPNLIYLQTTAMGESLYLALFIWSVVYCCEFMGGETNALTKCGVCLAAACLSRYDGWLVAAAMVGLVVVRYFWKGSDLKAKSNAPQQKDRRAYRQAVARFILIAASAPALWITYNAVIYRNPLEFENGPYSARAIERKTENEGHPGHPGSGNPLVAGMYFLKAAEMNVAENVWLQRLWIVLAFSALAIATVLSSGREKLGLSAAFCALLLLLLPLIFYVLSVAYGGVPIFVPAWWPFSYYNIRYGLQLLPAFALSVGVIVFLVSRSRRHGAETDAVEGKVTKIDNSVGGIGKSTRWRLTVVLAVFVFAIVSDASIWWAGPATLREAQVNMRTRNQLEKSLADWLKRLPADATLLMYLGDHVGALQQAGIPLRRVINEGNHRVWMQPSDPEGLWERALANPSGYADFAIGFEGDPVWNSAKAHNLAELVEIHVAGQARAVVYRVR